MHRSEIRDQYSFDYEKKSDPQEEAPEKLTCALLCIAYAVGDLAEAVWAVNERMGGRSSQG